jgi:hypothetical protein
MGMRYGLLAYESNKYIAEIYNLFAILNINDVDKQDHLITSLKQWQQSTFYTPLQSVDICQRRAFEGLKMPWELKNE